MNSEEDLFRGCGVEIKLPMEDSFLTVRETLTRIGVSSRKDKTLFQSCHILHKRGRYVIIHFKELFVLDGKKNTLTEDDLARRNTIVNLLVQWNLLEKANKQEELSPIAPLSKIKIISHKEKSEWSLVQKYTIGSK
jgi:hypothetical protein